jgi:hypothetical protein
MADRIELPPIAIERLIHSARLDRLTADTTSMDRHRSIETAVTALDALCGLVDRDGTDEVWDVFASLDRRALLTLATFAITELSDTEYTVAWREAHHGDAADPPVS